MALTHIKLKKYLGNGFQKITEFKNFVYILLNDQAVFPVPYIKAKLLPLR